MSKWKRYTKSEMHALLFDKTRVVRAQHAAAFEDADGWIYAQALECPYYAPLEGSLGGDWGVNLNPLSPLFGQLVFEHDWCGCPLNAEGQPDHPPVQRDDAWLKAKP